MLWHAKNLVSVKKDDQGADAGASPPPIVTAGAAGASWSRPFI
jgi:hypothetical protein